MADIRSRALTLIREGRVVIRHALTQEDRRSPYRVSAVVYGHTGHHRVSYGPTMPLWNCSCGRQPVCAHIAATALVTGDPSLARREAA